MKLLPAEAMRSPGAFGPEVEVVDDASDQDKLMGFLGRKPWATCHDDPVDPSPLDAEAVCPPDHDGGVTGRPHEIEIWFTALGDSLYLISGGEADADWVQNLGADPAATVRVGEETIPVVGRVPVHPGEERTVAIDRLHDKYGSQVTGTREDWHRTAFIVALGVHPHTR